MILAQSLEFFKGVGPKRAEMLYKAFGVKTGGDFLRLFPLRYIDKTVVKKIKDINQDDGWILIKAKVSDLQIIGDRKKRLNVVLTDGTGFIQAVWFQYIEHFATILSSPQFFFFYGKVNVFNKTINLPHPEIEVDEGGKGALKYLLPVYSSTESLKRSRFDDKLRRGIVQTILDQTNEQELREMIPTRILSRLGYAGLLESFRQIHFPDNLSKAKQARERFVFEEFYLNQINLMLRKIHRKKAKQGLIFSKVGELFNNFYHHHLPFQLTDAQKRVIKEIRNDMGSGFQLNRLLQGDVGSGKTIVAFMACLIAIDNKYQSCIMAPLEILARQHFLSIQKFANPLGIKVALLTGTTKVKERKQILEDLHSGAIDIIIGTHALVEDKVQFTRLGLVIIDEQHRFGVEQRAALWGKTADLPPHVIVMTATPIPRTLAMSVYGDLDVSIIDELPPGRKPIKTLHIHEIKRTDMDIFLKDQIKLGRQVFVVYPLIEESEKMDLIDLQNGYDRLFKEFPPPEYQISVIHGKMKNDVKKFEMDRFIQGQTQILVATTVIEVGVDIPNASVMVIENAERFGLSQLHQLRGRVGRGADQSYCILMTSYRLSEDAKIRINTMVDTNDGFTIAEVDLSLRGPGSMEGVRQSGSQEFRIADLKEDGKLFNEANAAAIQTLTDDPRLQNFENLPLRQYIVMQRKINDDWSDIS